MCQERPVRCIKGISEAREKALNHLGLYTVKDLCQFYPREYEDRTQIVPISFLTPDIEASLVARVISIAPTKRIRNNLSVTSVLVQDSTATLTLVFYNQNYIRKSLLPGREYCFYGKVTRGYRSIEICNPVFADSATGAGEFQRLLPVYSLTAGISQNIMRKIMKEAVTACCKEETETLPAELKERYALMAYPQALRNVHFPEERELLSQARRRFVFEELLNMALMLRCIKSDTEELTDGIVFGKTPMTHQLLQNLPFSLSEHQQKVWQEIQADMESPRIMNRLVMGDVGSGKTIIAVLAMVKAIASDYQAAFMAPTEILAEQHYHNIKKYMEPLGISVGLLTGSLGAKQKQQIVEELRTGQINCIIGTHALIQKGVEFCRPGLVITDEQHRFGVRQRGTLSSYGKNCDVLVMTATPIPRTLALILYGDLDISTIAGLPQGRKPIKTYGVDESYRQRIYTWARKLAEAGQQVYIVHPLIEEKEESDLASAQQNFREASVKYFAGLSTALVHGKMKAREKEAVMRSFAAGEIAVLFSTTVIEVGVDVANATLMIVENAERFGLAQLHQLRGRVGRGNLQSYCVLFNQGQGQLTKKRIETMVNSSDGFEIAQKDLELRGPGEFFGTLQHGIPQFKIANLYEDTAILQEALAAADWMIASQEPRLTEYREKVLSELSGKLNL